MKFLHLLCLTVTTAASIRLVGPVNWRGRVAVVEKLVCAAVTILARSRLGDALVNRYTVITLKI